MTTQPLTLYACYALAFPCLDIFISPPKSLISFCIYQAFFFSPPCYDYFMGINIPPEPPSDPLPPVECPDIPLFLTPMYNLLGEYDQCDETPCFGVCESYVGMFQWLETFCEDCPFAFYVYHDCTCVYVPNYPFSYTSYQCVHIFQGCAPAYGDWPV
jgi:hypothetical protein